MPRHYESLRLQ